MAHAASSGPRLLSDEVVFFMGAGASRGEGYPLMSTFLDDLKAAWPSGGDTHAVEKRQAFEALLGFRSHLSTVRDVVTTDFDNIEQLYSAAEMLSMAVAQGQTNPVYGPKAARDLPRHIAMAIWHMCRLRPFKDQVHKMPSVHHNLVGLLAKLEPLGIRSGGQCRVVFVTTNYDVLIELAARKHGISYGETVCFHEFRGKDRSKDHCLKVLKLHGSVNWFVSGEKSLCDLSDSNFPKVGEDFHTYPWPTIQASSYEIPESYSPLIVPPSFSKHAGHEVLRNVWAEAIGAIAGAKILVFIGYSFPRTDTFVQQLLHIGLLQNHDLRRVIVVDPDPGVGEYARNQVFNEVFSRQRLRFMNQEFNPECVREIRREIEGLENRAVL